MHIKNIRLDQRLGKFYAVLWICLGFSDFSWNIYFSQQTNWFNLPLIWKLSLLKVKSWYYWNESMYTELFQERCLCGIYFSHSTRYYRYAVCLAENFLQIRPSRWSFESSLDDPKFAWNSITTLNAIKCDKTKLLVLKVYLHLYKV